MKLLGVTTLVTSVGLVVAQSAGDLPKCAQPCVTQQTTGDGIGGCDSFDVKCICSNDSFLDEIACCLAERCDEDEQEEAVKFAKNFCESAGVTDLPDEVTCSSPSASSSAAGPAETAGGDSNGDDGGSGGGNDGDDEDSQAGPAANIIPGGLVGGIMAAFLL